MFNAEDSGETQRSRLSLVGAATELCGSDVGITEGRLKAGPQDGVE